MRACNWRASSTGAATFTWMWRASRAGSKSLASSGSNIDALFTTQVTSPSSPAHCSSIERTPLATARSRLTVQARRPLLRMSATVASAAALEWP